MGRLTLVLGSLLVPAILGSAAFYHQPQSRMYSAYHPWVSPLTYQIPGLLQQAPLQPSLLRSGQIPYINGGDTSIMGNRKHEYFSQHTYMGNRNFEDHPLTSYQAGCADLTSQWHVGETGTKGTIKVKRDRSGFDHIWELEMVYDKPVQKMEVTNGIVDQVSGQRFRITPTSVYFRNSGLGSDDVKVGFKATYDKSDEASVDPVLETIIINGKYHSCNTQRPTSRPQRPAMIQRNTNRIHPAWPDKVLGLYILLADDDEDGYESNAVWAADPELYDWQREGSNVLFFTFIHPETMDVPDSYQKLAATRGSDAPGSVPANTVIMFAIGGYAYSLKPNPWHWLTSREAAEKMAEKVATWPEKYGCDGIDLDLEEGAGSKKAAGPNMIHFVRKLKELNPSIIVSQPTYGWPAVQAEIDVINASWDSNGKKAGIADSIGLMVYQGADSLNYVKNYDSSKRWQGHPIPAAVPNNAILLGAKGVTSSSDIATLAQRSVSDDLLGIMVWYASVKNGFQYKQSQQWDASISEDSIRGFKAAMATFRQGGAVPRRIY